MESNRKVVSVVRLLEKEYPRAKIALRHSNPMQLLVAVMLSAQCTDKRVNIVTEELFKKYKIAQDFAKADLEKFQQEIRSTGFYRNKAKNIIAAARIIENKFNSRVPDTMEGLLELPGVARKTGNIVLSNAYGKLEGIAIDTHMKRVNFRLGLTANVNPDKIEQDLIRIVAKKLWNHYTYLIIEHGRAVCKAPVPRCSSCVIDRLCPKNGVGKRL